MTSLLKILITEIPLRTNIFYETHFLGPLGSGHFTHRLLWIAHESYTLESLTSVPGSRLLV